MDSSVVTRGQVVTLVVLVSLIRTPVTQIGQKQKRVYRLICNDPFAAWSEFDNTVAFDSSSGSVVIVSADYPGKVERRLAIVGLLVGMTLVDNTYAGYSGIGVDHVETLY